MLNSHFFLLCEIIEPLRRQKGGGGLLKEILERRELQSIYFTSVLH